jgi:hypothetical protein
MAVTITLRKPKTGMVKKSIVLALTFVFFTASPLHASASNGVPSCSSDDMHLMVWRSIMEDGYYAHGQGAYYSEILESTLKTLVASEDEQDKKRIQILSNSIPGLATTDIKACRLKALDSNPGAPDVKPAVAGSMLVMAYVVPSTNKIAGFVSGFDPDNPKATEKLLDIKDINAADRATMQKYGISPFQLWLQKKKADLMQ